MKTVARFHKAEDAYLFRSYLESEDIAAYVFDEYVPQVQWLWTQAIGGIRVLVGGEDTERAVELYREYESRLTALPSVVGDVKIWPLALLATIAIGVPFMIFGRNPPDSAPGNP
jgi:hypothetical protein